MGWTDNLRDEGMKRILNLELTPDQVAKANEWLKSHGVDKKARGWATCGQIFTASFDAPFGWCTFTVFSKREAEKIEALIQDLLKKRKAEKAGIRRGVAANAQHNG